MQSIGSRTKRAAKKTSHFAAARFNTEGIDQELNYDSVIRASGIDRFQ
jgi:hypothetical protein